MQNTAPDYYIRVINDQGEEINITNATSISVQKDINGDVGKFSISLNYDQNFYNKNLQDTVTYNQNSVFFKIKPMDYVEIYLSRSGSKFGIYNKQGVFLRDFQTGIPCNIVERITNPSLIICGFIDAIDNNFSVSDSSTNNSITIEGSCLAKILSVHHLFFNFPYWDLFTKQAISGFVLVGTRPQEAIDAILSTYCLQIFDSENAIIDSGVDKIKSKQAPQKKTETKWLPDEKNNKNKIASIVHNTAPSFRNIYWGIDKNFNTESKVTKDEKNDFFDWGRMEYINNPSKNPYNITSESPVLSILKDVAQTNTNEFFIDEIGNIVLRNQLNAWDFKYSSNHAYISDFVELNEEDIRSWNFSISDNELKTVVLDVMADTIFGIQPSMVSGTAVAPISDSTANQFLKNPKADSYTASIISQIRKMQGKHLDRYDLSTTKGILDFWAKFGLRPYQITDIYSDSPAKSYANAWTWFQKYSNYWWKGSITVKGDSKYKIGQKGFITEFALDLNGQLRNFNFYIQGVSHNFSWGNDWTTTLTFTRGEIEGTFTSETIKVKSS